ATAQPAAHPAPQPPSAPAPPTAAGQLPVAQIPPAPAAPTQPATAKPTWQVVEQARAAKGPQGPTAEDRSYAEWFAWAKRGGEQGDRARQARGVARWRRGTERTAASEHRRSGKAASG